MCHSFGKMQKKETQVGKLKDCNVRLEKMKGNMLKWARGEILGPKRNLTGPSQDTISVCNAQRGFIRFIFVFCT